MIPKVTQEAKNIAPHYWCSVCGKELPKYKPGSSQLSGWKFCSFCGNPIEWDKAGPPVIIRTTVKVTLADGDTIVTTINCDEAAARAYYAIGKIMNVGSVNDNLIAIARVEVLGREEIPL